MATLELEKLGKEPIICVKSSSCMTNVAKSSNSTTATSDPKSKRNLVGIRNRKNGRFAAVITDPIRHKEVWLGIFDTVEEASGAYFFKKSEFEKLVKVDQGQKEPIISAKSCKEASFLMASVCGAKSSDGSVTSHPKAKRSLPGIRRQKNGWYDAVVIRDPIRPKKSEFEKSSKENMENKPKNCDQIQLEPPAGASSSMGSDQALSVTSLGRNKTVHSHKPKHFVGVGQEKSGRYRSRIQNPISKKEFWLGTFDTAEEASQAYQSKKLDFQKLVDAKLQCHSQTHSNAGEEKQCEKVELINVNRGHVKINPKGFQPESASGASSSEIEVSISNSSNGGTDHTINSHKMSQGNMENKPKNCDQIQLELPAGASSFVGRDQTLNVASLGRNKTVHSHTPKHFVGVGKEKSGRYRSRIRNPISKKEFWLGTFDTAEEASQAYQSKKLEFQKLVEAKWQCHRQNHSNAGEKKQGGKVELINVNRGHETINTEGFQPESASGASSSEIEVPISNSSDGGTDHAIDSHKMSHFKGLLDTDEEAFCADQCKKFECERSKKAELQSNMPTNSSAGENLERHQEDEDLWTGDWMQLPGDRAVKFSLKLGLPIIDNYGSLLGEFSNLDDLSIC